MSYQVHSLHGLIAWLKGQPPKTKYYYGDYKDCLGARYCKAHGLFYNIPKAIRYGDFAQQLEHIAIRNYKRTYEGAIEIAQEILEETS